MSGNGWCTHPDRQVSSDVRILVRKAELACRNAWGSDLWEDANAPEAPAAQPPSAPQVEIPAPSIQVSYDDEVTSVVSADEHASARSPRLDDEVVDESTISFIDDYDDEQDERRDLLYRDSRSAIERARQRHVQRRHQPAHTEDDVVISHGEDSDIRAAGSLEQPVFEPDDFVEEETPASTPVTDEHDDALLSEGIRTQSPRSRRLRRFRDEKPLPKELTATKIEPEIDEVELELPPGAAPDRGRFDSIPEISADIELPLLRRSSSATEPKNQPTQQLVPEATSYERALKRAHALHTAARVEINHERRRATSPAAIGHESTPGSMPDLPDSPSTEPRSRGPEPSLEVPVGTSAVLHPRKSVEHNQGHQNRAGIRPPRRQPEQARPRMERPVREKPEARQSWWRGARASGQQENLPETIPVGDGSSDWHTAPVDMPVNEPMPAHPAPQADPADQQRVPKRVAFDLEQDGEMDSFRDRLFSHEPVANDAPRKPKRNPISVARREQRPISPATRPRIQAIPEAETEGAFAERSAPEPHREVERQPQRPPDRVLAPHRQAERAAESRPRLMESVQPEMLLQAPEDALYEPEPMPGFDVRNLIEADTELLDMTIQISPEIPRACATCRSYRPSEQPGRGWCTNTWAFTHRQMVNETDIACDSTIGCWWLPADEEVWLDEFEVAADSTPRVDRLLAHLNPERRVVGN